MDIRQLQYLCALVREKHFTRAADACNVTQPTLSGRIRQLEHEIGVAIVKRGRRFHGLTEEGERVLEWAQKILNDCASLQQELVLLKGEFAARAVLGVIPSATQSVSILTEAVRARHPQVTLTILSRTSREILTGLNESTLDAGISYLDNEPVGRAATVPMYMERYCLFARTDHALARRKEVSWAEAAGHSLGLLTPDMQNRRIIEGIFADLGIDLDPDVESNSIATLFAHIRIQGIASILPEDFLSLVGNTDIVAVPLVEPFVEHSVGLVVSAHTPRPPLVGALLDAAKQFGSSRRRTAG